MQSLNPKVYDYCMIIPAGNKRTIRFFSDTSYQVSNVNVIVYMPLDHETSKSDHVNHVLQLDFGAANFRTPKTKKNR